MTSLSKKLQPLAFSLLLIGTISGAMFSQNIYAYDETSTSSINIDKQKIILQGYDAVAYFTEQTPTPGDKQLSTTYGGAIYLFASEENLKAFQANPVKFAPQFGGFCAMGAALGKKLDGDPQVWKIVDGKLYLNVNSDAMTKWSEDIPGNLQKANDNWPHIKDKAPKDL